MAKDCTPKPMEASAASIGDFDAKLIEKQSRRHPAFSAMKDVTWIAPGVDLTEPAMPEWADLVDEKYGKKP